MPRLTAQKDVSRALPRERKELKGSVKVTERQTEWSRVRPGAGMQGKRRAKL